MIVDRKVNLLKYIFTVIFMLFTVFIYPQDSKSNEDKFTSTNIIPLVITESRLGTIIQYYQGVDLKYLYLPNDFFNTGKAVWVFVETSNTTPQISVIFKNSKPFRIKIYKPRNASSLTYRYKEMLTDEEIEKFKTKEILVDFY